MMMTENMQTMLQIPQDVQDSLSIITGDVLILFSDHNFLNFHIKNRAPWKEDYIF